MRTPEQLTAKIQELGEQLDEMSGRLNEKLYNLRSVNVNLRASEDYFETRPVYQEMKKSILEERSLKKFIKRNSADIIVRNGS